MKKYVVDVNDVPDVVQRNKKDLGAALGKKTLRRSFKEEAGSPRTDVDVG